jgi:hypothetical protein
MMPYVCVHCLRHDTHAPSCPVSLAERREKIADGLRQLKAEADHWNKTHPNEAPIVVDFDLTKDVEAARQRRLACETCRGTGKIARPIEASRGGEPPLANPNDLHCKDPQACRGESYCSCQCGSCRAARDAGAAFYAQRTMRDCPCCTPGAARAEEAV